MLQFDDKQYIWSNEWIVEAESFWSIIEKFKYLNAESCLDKDYFEIKPSSTQMYDEINHIYRKNMLYNHKNLRDKLFINETHYKYLYPFANSEYYDYTKLKFCYCPLCIENGYHSYIHQLIFENKCFLHNVPLVKTDYDYCISNTQYPPLYKEVINSNGRIKESGDLLIDLMNNRSIVLSNKPNILNKIHIININNFKLVDYMYEYKNLLSFLHSIYWNKKFSELSIKPLITVKKGTGDEMWENIKSSLPNTKFYSELDIFEKYTYSFLDKLKDKVSYIKLNEARTNLSNAYVCKKMYPNVFEKHDKRCIAILTTMYYLLGENNADILLGNEKYYRRLSNRISYYFDNLYYQCEDNDVKVAYWEIYKQLHLDMYSYFKQKAYNEELAEIDTFEITRLYYEYPIYVIIENDKCINVYNFWN